MSSSNKIIFITGANTGLGLETVKSLLRSSNSYTILLGGRDFNKATAAAEEVKTDSQKSSSTVEPVQIDLESDESIQQAFETISKKYDRIDCLLNNGGGQFDQQIVRGSLSIREAWNKSWDVNVTGTHILTHTFVPLLLKSLEPRLIFMTSGTSTLTDHGNEKLPINRSPPKGWPKESLMVPAYRSAKTGLNMMMAEWDRILKEDGVKTVAISPGMLATGLGGIGPEALKKMGALDPQVGANFVRDVVEGKRDQDIGKVVRKDGVQPW